MKRASGLILTLVIVGLMVASRAQSIQRGERLLAGEVRAHAVVSALVRASAPELAAGEPHPGLRAIAHVHPPLQLLPERGDGRVGYAQDAEYVYGLARTVDELDGGGSRHGYVLRAWPRRYGDTGDVEFHVGADQQLWVGQNQKGRSGFGRGFPPSYPEPELSPRGGRWWRSPLDDVGR